jgi:histidyl-tRNA synthetase
MNTGPARGMRDFLPEDVRRRQFVIGVIADVYQRYGFEPLETPAVENIETLMGKYGEEGDRLIFKILKRGEGAETGQADLALRYDLTVPLARVVAEYRAKLPKFFKRYQVQPVWRADRPQKGRFREFYQCDVDAIGSTSMVVETELLAAAADVLARLGFADFRVRLNHRQLLTAILNCAGVETALHGAALVALDKSDKVSQDDVAAEMAERGIPAEASAKLRGLLFGLQSRSNAGASNDELLRDLRAFVTDSAEGMTACGQLDEILRLSQATSARAHIRIDPILARGLGYYTGAIFEIAVPDLAGSLGGGGRYDNLVGMFSGTDVPACGISLGLERILVVMAERNMFPPTLATTPADVMVVQWFAGRTELYLQLAGELRAAGLRVELYPEAPDQDGKKVGDKQFKYAAARGIPCVAVIGAAELENGTVVVKNMKIGTQSAIPREDVAAHLKAQI